MLINFVLYLFRINFSKMIFHKFSLIFEFISILVSYLIYFYTSKAFMLGDNVFGSANLNYFDYIVAAELALALPLYFIESPMRNIKESIDTKVINTYLLLKWSSFKVLLICCYSDLLRVVWRIILSVFVLKFFFVTELNFSNLQSALVLLVLNLPFAIAIGVLLVSIYLILGRGQFLVGQLNVVLSVLSGAFFPVSVFPAKLSEFVERFIPFTKFLTDIRSAQVTNYSFVSFLLWICLLFVIYRLFKFGILKYMNRGLSIIRF